MNEPANSGPNNKPDSGPGPKVKGQRPVSPFMLGSYYRFQITSVLSILSRLTGLYLAVFTAPLAIVWLLALASGPESYQHLQSCLGSWLGRLLVVGSLFSLAYHLCNGVRHLAWDLGFGFEMRQVRRSGYLMLVVTLLLCALTLWGAW